MRIKRIKRFRKRFFMGSVFFAADEEYDKDVPRHSHTVDDTTYKVAESYGHNGRFEPVSEIDSKDTVLSRSSIAVTKPDSDVLVFVSNENVEVMRHNKECASINDFSYKTKNQIGKINAERGRL